MTTLINPPSEPPVCRDAPGSVWIGRLFWIATALAIVLPLFCHGCHGDEDTELFISAQEKSPRYETVGSRIP
jgi:hypothetical protein